MTNLHKPSISRFFDDLDVFGLALARPDLLRPEYKTMILNRLLLEVVSANIRAVTDGRMYTPLELYASLINDPTGTTLDILELVFRNFRA